jgi:hypothetical protein
LIKIFIDNGTFGEDVNRLNLQPENLNQIEKFLCSNINSVVTQLDWIKSIDADLNPHFHEIRKHITNSDFKKFPIFLVETNFTQSCKAMPWVDNAVRLVFKMYLKPGTLNITGTRTISPFGHSDLSKTIREEIPFMIIKNVNNY